MPAPHVPVQPPLALDNSPEPALRALFRAAIGPVATDYYLERLMQFEAQGRAGVRWNGSAALYHLNWLVFRGLWRQALLAAALVALTVVLLLALGFLLLHWPPELTLLAALLSLLPLGLVCGLWGNAWLYRRCRADMAQAVASQPALQAACEQLALGAPTRARLIRVMGTNAAVLLLLGGAGSAMLWRGLDQAADEPPVVMVQGAVSPPPAAAAPALATASAVSAPQAATGLAALPAAPASSAASAALATGAASQAVAASVATPTARTAAPGSAGRPASAVAPASAPASAVAAALTKPAAGAPASASASASQAAPAGPGWRVNAGLFAQAANAERVVQTLRNASLPVSAHTLQTAQGPLIRVRAGPFATQAQAQAAVQRIQALGLDAALVKP